MTVVALAGIAILGSRLSVTPLRMRRMVRAALVLAASVAAAVFVPGLLGTAEVRHSQAAERIGNTDQALSWATKAVSIEPWAASAYEQRGLVLEGQRRLGSAAADLQRAVSDEHTNFNHWLVLARIETERGRYDPALRDYRRARQLHPQDTIFTYAPLYIRALLAAGR
ncbi:MAG: tetratricopeptide repeat protein [Solirubrobacteraceae bacterium]